VNEIKNKRVAIVHDWLTAYGGAEVVLRQTINLFSSVDLFCILKDRRNEIFKEKKIRNTYQSYLKNIPYITKNYKFFASLMPKAVESFDLRKYDIIVTSSWAFSHGVYKKSINAKHLAYIHTPMRWAWDMEDDYLKLERFTHGLRPIIKWQLNKLRQWDRLAAKNPDKLIANSKFVQHRIKDNWNRDSLVIYPPVEVPEISSTENHGAFVSLSRLVPYKRIDIIINAFHKLPEKKLIVIGSGPQLQKLKMEAPKNVTFVENASNIQKFKILQGALGLIQASKEDFGISVVEAQALGIPVLAYDEGGARETVLDINKSNKPTGLLFKYQNEDSLTQAILEFSKIKFEPKNCKNHAKKFSAGNFRAKMISVINTLPS
jgi:glycosyltransferase involved in cell wall biosynthesis